MTEQPDTSAIRARHKGWHYDNAADDNIPPRERAHLMYRALNTTPKGTP